MEHVLDGGAHEDGLVEVDLQLHPLGRGGLDDGELLARSFHHRQRARIRLLEDGQVGGAPAVDPHQVLLHGLAVADPRHVVGSTVPIYSGLIRPAPQVGLRIGGPI